MLVEILGAAAQNIQASLVPQAAELPDGKLHPEGRKRKEGRKRAALSEAASERRWEVRLLKNNRVLETVQQNESDFTV